MSPRRRDLLIEHLHKIQDRYGCLSARHLVALAAEMKMAMAEVYEVATFYHHFDVVKEGETRRPRSRSASATRSRAISPARTICWRSCRRCSAQACACCTRLASAAARPRRSRSSVRIRSRNATAEQVAEAVQGRARDSPAAQTRAVTPGHIDYAAYRAPGGYALAASCVAGARKPADVIALMEDSGLRGLGGAGFPAGRKWKLVAAEPAPRLMAINIDEGEPGTFKDRYYLERDPHRFLEGALIAAWAVGIDAIYIYLRDEYHGCRAILEREIAALQANPPCPIPAIHLRRGAGAYICGEESSMIESIEGKRGEPRLRPPYVAQVGLFGRPTLEHNMETLHWVRDIIEKGPAWFAGHGRQRAKGSALVLGERTRQEARRASCAGWHHVAGADRRILRRHARRARVLRVSAGRRVGRNPARVEGRHPSRFRHVERVRLLHRVGGDRRLFRRRTRRPAPRAT